MVKVQKMKLLTIVIICVCTAGNVLASDDWAYELSSEAKRIYEKKIIQDPCRNIPELLRQGNTQDLYYTIRDAGLFRTESCGAVIQRHVDALSRLPGVKYAIAFYFYRLGDKQQLKVLAAVFDKEARATGDHWVIELFGFLDDWDISGVRLVRHAAYSDAAASELLCSALMWRRYLYGEKFFKKNWYTIGNKEKIAQRTLDHFYERCQCEPKPMVRE